MGVIDAQHLQRLSTRLADGLKVVARIDDKSACSIVGGISSGHRPEDPVVSAEQQTTALLRACPICVGQDGLFCCSWEDHTPMTIKSYLARHQ